MVKRVGLLYRFYYKCLIVGSQRDVLFKSGCEFHQSRYNGGVFKVSAKSIVLVAIGVVSMYCATIWAHTESEYLNMARNMIGTLLSSGWDSEEEMLEHQQSDDPLYHWNYTSFLSRYKLGNSRLLRQASFHQH